MTWYKATRSKEKKKAGRVFGRRNREREVRFKQRGQGRALRHGYVENSDLQEGSEGQSEAGGGPGDRQREQCVQRSCSGQGPGLSGGQRGWSGVREGECGRKATGEGTGPGQGDSAGRGEGLGFDSGLKRPSGGFAPPVREICIWTGSRWLLCGECTEQGQVQTPQDLLGASAVSQVRDNSGSGQGTAGDRSWIRFEGRDDSIY